MAEYWQAFALDEIDRSERRLSLWDRDFLDSIREDILSRASLTRAQDDRLMRIYQRMTDVKRLKR